MKGARQMKELRFNRFEDVEAVLHLEEVPATRR
jgi:hypothetical protein